MASLHERIVSSYHAAAVAVVAVVMNGLNYSVGLAKCLSLGIFHSCREDMCANYANAPHYYVHGRTN